LFPKFVEDLAAMDHELRKQGTREDEPDFDRQLHRLERRLPRGLARFIRWMREPSSVWVRIPAGIALILAGFIGFLPILGFWMIPLGAILVAQDIPFIQRPTARLIAWALRKWPAGKEHSDTRAD
jgi:hypothetical protein